VPSAAESGSTAANCSQLELSTFFFGLGLGEDRSVNIVGGVLFKLPRAGRSLCM
jgi:hypothetical protein